MSQNPEPCVVVIFGASGDLTQRKLVPSLYDLHQQGSLPKGACVLGVSRTEYSDEAFREQLREPASEHAGSFDAESWAAFAQRVHDHATDATEVDSYEGLNKRITALGEKHGIAKPSGGPNVLFYLSVSPSLYEPIIDAVGQSDLVSRNKRWCSINPDDDPWQRIIVEKPFGKDTESAASLNKALGRVFDEDKIYRIDHYLAKEVVQNILVMRFANTIFEPLWNRYHIDHVQITASEEIGVGRRAANYYDGSAGGALRDMVQSHLLQVLALVGMEPPSVYDADAIMQEKIKLFNAGVIAKAEQAGQRCAFGRYGKGQDFSAYAETKGVQPERHTETFAAIKVEFDNWRWASVPFYLRSGKAMKRKLTEVVIQFKPAHTNLFRRMPSVSGERTPNRLVMNVAPNEGMSIRVEGKVPGAAMKIASANFGIDYAEAFGGERMEAYGPLILDAMEGDRMLFKHRDEVEASWRICEPFLDPALREDIETYEAGSWGPGCADAMIARDGRAWHNPGPDEML